MGAFDGRSIKKALAAHWLLRYRSTYLAGDFSAAVITTLLLVPQGIAYALLAKLPPLCGIYASILPQLAYALLGSSRTLSVGPMAITSLMTAAALAPLASADTATALLGAAWLAIVSGVVLLLCGLLRFGFLAQLLSRPVLSGFTTASALLIGWSQAPPLLGLTFAGPAPLSLDALQHLTWSPQAMSLGLATLLALWLLPRGLRHLTARRGLPHHWLQLLVRLLPAIMIAAATLCVALGNLDSSGVAVVGTLQTHGLTLDAPEFQTRLIADLLLPAAMIALVSFVSSLSIAQSLAALRHEQIDANAEMRGLGAANIVAGLSGGLPVNGGLSRSAVNFAAGAQTPLAGILSAAAMLVVALIGGDWFRHIPIAALAATIIVALSGLIDISMLRQAWRYDRADAAAWLVAAAGVLAFGVVSGIALGVATSVVSLAWRSSHPHIAVLGRLPDSQQFRNVERYRVECLPNVLICRIDENLFFGNVQAVIQRLHRELDRHGGARHLLLVLSSVSMIDMTALESLTQLNSELERDGIQLHLSDIKGPVLDRLRQGTLLKQLSGQVHASTYDAYRALDGSAAPDYMI